MADPSADAPSGPAGGASPESAPNRQELLLFGVIFCAVWLLWSTWIVFPLKILVVFLHEISHALAALVTGGSVHEIVVNVYQGGYCKTSGGWRFAILSAGYLGSMGFGAAILLLAARTKNGDRGLAIALGVFLAIMTVVYVPVASFGFVFGLVSSAGLVLVGTKLPNEVADALLKTIGVTSCLYAVLDIKSDIVDRFWLVGNYRHPTDAQMLADLTHIPTLIWGLLWIAIAIVVTGFVFWKAIRVRPQ